jgi:hypothetical protein
MKYQMIFKIESLDNVYFQIFDGGILNKFEKN